MPPRVIQSDAVILAAGSSSRLGFPKQLLELEGVTLLRRTAGFACMSNCRRTVVVLGSQASLMRAELDGLEVEILQNADWREGVGTSVRLAARSALKLPDCPPALLFLTCDQPGVRCESINKILAAADGPATIVAAAYADTLGIPALFKRVHFPELAQLRGDQGAKPLIRKHRAQVLPIPLPEARIDVDTESDLESLRSRDSRA